MSFFQAFSLDNQASGPGAPPPGPFRPPQWSQVQPNTSLSVVLPASGPAAAPSTATNYFFDAVLRLDHMQEMRITDHPVQNGASIVDHAFLHPARLVLEIGMSDAMASYQNGQYTGASTKSVSAYKTFIYLQGLRVPLTVNTRLRLYSNMLIEAIRAADDNRTAHALRALISFRQVILGTVTTQPQSNRPDQSNSNNDGTVPTQAPPASLPNYGSNGNFSSEPNGGVAP